MHHVAAVARRVLAFDGGGHRRARGVERFAAACAEGTYGGAPALVAEHRVCCSWPFARRCDVTIGYADSGGKSSPAEVHGARQRRSPSSPPATAPSPP